MKIGTAEAELKGVGFAGLSDQLKALLESYQDCDGTEAVERDGEVLLRKDLAFEVKAVEGKDRVIRFVASDETPDRSGDIVSVKGWDLKAWRRNPVILYGHDYFGLPVGRGVHAGVEEGQLVIDVEFPDRETYEFGDTVFRMVKGGFLKAVSVGFIPKEWEEIPDEPEAPEDAGKSRQKLKQRFRRKYLKQELLELSVVTVPANPNALRLALEKGVITQAEAQRLEKPFLSVQPAGIPAPAGKEMPEDAGALAALLQEIKELRSDLAVVREVLPRVEKQLAEWNEGGPEEVPAAPTKGDSDGEAGEMPEARGPELHEDLLEGLEDLSRSLEQLKRVG